MEKRIYPEQIETIVTPEPEARQSFTDAEEAVELSNSFKGSKVLLRVWSRGTTKYLFVTVGGNEQENDTPQTRPRGQGEEPE